MRTVFCLLIAIIGWAGLGKQQTGTDDLSGKTMHQIFLEDQADREAPGGAMSSLNWSKINPRDEARRKRVRAMLEAGTLGTGADYRETSFIFQHSSEPDDYRMAHILATAALAKGDQESRWISAATLDRYLQHIGQSQVFGTQYQKTTSTEHPRRGNPVRGPIRNTAGARGRGFSLGRGWRC